MPWWGQGSIPVAEIEQFYRQLNVTESRDNTGWLSWSVSYPLVAVLRGGGAIKLLELTDAEAVLYLEQQIERRLGIADQPIADEMVKDGWVPRS